MTEFYKYSFKLSESVHPQLKDSCRLPLMHHESSRFNMHDIVSFHTCSAWVDCHVCQYQTDVNSLIFMLPKYILITLKAWQRKSGRYFEVDLMENIK